MFLIPVCFNTKVRISDFIQIKGESQHHPLKMANEGQEMEETGFLSQFYGKLLNCGFLESEDDVSLICMHPSCVWGTHLVFSERS